MERRNKAWTGLEKHALSEAAQRRVKGGHINIPSGTGSTGLVGWDEIDIRANDDTISDRGGRPRVMQWLFR